MSETLKRRIAAPGPKKILACDGGGILGLISVEILARLEADLRAARNDPNLVLADFFDFACGTSTGAIIAALLALGHDVEGIHQLYKRHVPEIMRRRSPAAKSRELARLAQDVFGSKGFADVKTGIGIVATKWLIERPMIFKGSASLAHGRAGTFVPGFGVSIAEAVQASCSAYPFFDRKCVQTASGDRVELIDGGYCANNPTLYAIADAVQALRKPPEQLRVVSIGVGAYPAPKPTWLMRLAKRYLVSVRLLQKTLDINTQSMEQLRTVLFGDLPTVRISDTFEQPEMATDFMEHDLNKLNLLRQRGSESFSSRELELRKLLLSTATEA